MKEKISRERFIRLGSAIGVSVAGASMISACGGGSGSSGSASESATQGTSGGGQAIARESELAPGSATKFKDSGKPAILVHLDSGEFAAYSAICTHQRCIVAYRGGQLACPCHGSIFDAANGEVINPPAPRPLTKIPIEVRNGEVFRV